MNIKKSLQSIDASGSNFYFNDVDVIPENIKAVLINEVVPNDRSQEGPLAIRKSRICS